jgi:hypothetical protein
MLPIYVDVGVCDVYALYSLKRCVVDRPSIGFCIELLLGSKYVGSLVVVGDLVEFRQAVKK